MLCLGNEEPGEELGKCLDGLPSKDTESPFVTQVFTSLDEGYSTLKCKDVSPRWQICGAVSSSKLVLGAGIRFMEYLPDGTLAAASALHQSCQAALADGSIPELVRQQSKAVCSGLFVEALDSVAISVLALEDTEGKKLFYNRLSYDERRMVKQAVTALRASDPGDQPSGCTIGPDFAVSCWGGGWMCAAWIDEDGADAACWECEIADCR